MADLSDFLGGLKQQVETGATGGITIESSLNAGFPFTIKPLAGGEASPIAQIFGNLVRPKITIDTPLGPVPVAPYGEPPDAPWLGVIGIAALAAVLGFGIYGVVRFVTR